MYKQLSAQKNNLAHAYVLSGDREVAREAILKFLEDDLSITVKANPNLCLQEYDRLGVEEVRALGKLQARSAWGEGQQIYIISCGSFTVEAQNAMLKMLEEPNENTIWFLLVRDHLRLLPTILSRVQLIEEESSISFKDIKKEFIQVPYLVREKLLKQFAGDIKKNIPADRSGLVQFITALMDEVRASKKEGWTTTYRELAELRGYAGDKSSSVKYITDYLSIIL